MDYCLAAEQHHFNSFPFSDHLFLSWICPDLVLNVFGAGYQSINQ